MIGLPQASSVAARVDLLFYALLTLCSLVALAVCVTIVWFCVKYRNGSAASRQGRVHRNKAIELTWIAIPLLLFLGVFGWSLRVWTQLRIAPADADTVYVVAKQWMWKVQHPGGQQEINALHVPLGQPTRLIMISQDVIHSFYVPAFRLKQDVLPGRYTDLWFTATRTGSFDLFCSQFCGMGHAVMGGKVVVMSPGDYADWLHHQPMASRAQRGKRLFAQLGCAGCHGEDPSMRAPRLAGIYDTDVHLADGSLAHVDDLYLHDAILMPNHRPVAGYAAVMPSYASRIDESDVLALIAYLKSPPTKAPDDPR